MYKSILKMFKTLNCLNSSNSLNLNCYNSYDSQTCLNLFRFNMIWIVTIHVILKHVWTCWNMSELVRFNMIQIFTIHVILKHVWTCSDSIRYELLRFMWFSNMSEHVETCLKLVQIQYDMNCYDSCDSQTCLNMSKHV